MIIAFDLETTGADPETCQILEVGAIAFNPDTGDEYGRFHSLVRHDQYTGSAYALAMNVEVLKALATKGDRTRGIRDVVWDLTSWVIDMKRAADLQTTYRPSALGFNVGSFDLQFLKKAWNTTAFPFSYRSIELGTLLMSVTESKTPLGSKQGAELLYRDVPHRALEDAELAKDLYMYATQGKCP